MRFAFGQTPVHVAISNKHFDVALLLASYGANISSSDEFGQTAFDALHDDAKERELRDAYVHSQYRNF